jgi:hypothetical protein
MALYENDQLPRPCSHAGCPSAATATLAFDYGMRRVWLHDLPDPPDPASYDLCSDHTDRFRPPRGWEVEDHRATLARSIIEQQIFQADASI